MTARRPCQTASALEPPDPNEAATGDDIPAWAYHTRGWRNKLRHLTPSWFSVTMGTGVVSVLLWSQPYTGSKVEWYAVDPTDPENSLQYHNLVWTHYLALAVFALNVGMFTVLLVASCLRYMLYPQIWPLMLRHPVQSLFLGTVPMGFATIVNMTVMSCVPVWGPWARTVVWVMWIIDAAVSVACSMSIPFVMMSIHPLYELQDMTAIWLLPVVASIVASSSGSLVASVLPNPTHALWTLLASYILWAMAVPLSFTILVIYFRRLTHHKLPPREVISSVLLPVGPFGQGAFSIIRLGKAAMKILPRTNTIPAAPLAGQVMYIYGIITGLLMWAFGLVWLTFAIASVFRTSKVPFNMGSWGFIFPFGVWALSSFAIGQELPSRFFNVVGVISSLIIFSVWIVVFGLTVKHSISGKMFFSPCVAALEHKAKAKRESKVDISTQARAEPVSVSSVSCGGGDNVGHACGQFTPSSTIERMCGMGMIDVERQDVGDVAEPTVCQLKTQTPEEIVYQRRPTGSILPVASDSDKYQEKE